MVGANASGLMTATRRRQQPPRKVVLAPVPVDRSSGDEEYLPGSSTESTEGSGAIEDCPDDLLSDGSDDGELSSVAVLAGYPSQQVIC